MIDCEKLKTLKARINQAIECLDDDRWSMSDSIDITRAFMKVSLLITDELIETNNKEELTQPSPKYVIGQDVWFLGEENQLCNDEITHSDMGIQNYIYYLMHYDGLFHESILYPTKQSLIDAQIQYWQSLKIDEISKSKTCKRCGMQRVTDGMCWAVGCDYKEECQPEEENSTDEI